VKVSREFRDAFHAVVHAFGLSAEEVELAKQAVERDFEAAQANYLATAALLRAGWKPRHQSIGEFKRDQNGATQQ
jgi:hypothetical protein